MYMLNKVQFLQKFFQWKTKKNETSTFMYENSMEKKFLVTFKKVQGVLLCCEGTAA